MCVILMCLHVSRHTADSTGTWHGELNRRKPPENKHTNCTLRFIISRESGRLERPVLLRALCFHREKGSIKSSYVSALSSPLQSTVLHAKTRSAHSTFNTGTTCKAIRYCDFFLSKMWIKVQVILYEKKYIYIFFVFSEKKANVNVITMIPEYCIAVARVI